MKEKNNVNKALVKNSSQPQIKNFSETVKQQLLNELGFKHPVFGGLRVIIKDDEPWFVLNEVCKTLGIKVTKVSNFDFLEMGVDNIPLIDTMGRKQITNIINEANLYSVIFKSRKSNAKDFRKWVYEEVLPQIRKNGKYVEGQQDNGNFDMEEFSKEFCNRKPLELGRTRLMQLLRDNDVLTKKNLPTQKYIQNGWMAVQMRKTPKGKPTYKAVITPKGISGILTIVKEHYLDEPHKDYDPNQYIMDFDNNVILTNYEYYN